VAKGGIAIRVRGLIACAVLAALVARPARAATLAELSAGVDRALAGRLGEAEEQALFGRLADVSVQVADRYDQWVRTGSAEQRAVATRLADGLRPLLERLHAYHQGRIDKAQKEIIAADGNPEILYEQRWWQLDRGFALAAAGQLAWLHYRSAMLHPDKEAQRKAWLRKAVREFSEFVAAEDEKMRLESYLGRAMAQRELGESVEAAADLDLVLAKGKSSPLYWPARLALGELRASQGGPAALSETRKLLADAQAAGLPPDTLHQIRIMRLDAMLIGADKGLSESTRRDAVALAAQISKLGPSWSNRVTDVVLRRMKDPRPILGKSASSEWIAAENLAAEEKFDEAIEAYNTIARSTDPAAREHATEVHHRLGICNFRLNRFVEAEREFRSYLNEAPDGPLASESAYLQFRSAEQIYRANATAETRSSFQATVENFVKRFPDHDSAYEGWFRYGELLQGERRYREAADAYAKVGGPPLFEIRAASAEIQSLADALSAPPADADDAWAGALRERVRSAQERFERLATEHRELASDELRARTTLSVAMAQSAGISPDLQGSLETLRDFETRYAELPDLHVLALALRLAVASGLRNYDEAALGVEKLPPAGGESPQVLDILERVARGLLVTAADLSTTDPDASTQWAALAGTVFERLQAAGRPLPGDVKSNLAQIYAEQGRLEDAAALYAELLEETPRSRTLLRNAAMLADRRGLPAEAGGYWSRLAVLQEVATPAWYEARLAAAKGLLDSGQADRACGSVREVEGFRPDLRDKATKKRFAELAASACREKD
jgi:tetratricopeptide (TPR) repeat protein